MGDLFPITLEDEISEVMREIMMRERNYPRWIEAGTLKREPAERQLEIMRRVLARLEALR